MAAAPPRPVQPRLAPPRIQVPSTRFGRTPRVIGALVLRNMVASNGRSALGYLWEIIEPVAYIAVLQAIFSLFVRSPPLGHSFALFYASGILPFLTFMAIANQTMNVIRVSRPLLVYPGVTFLHAILARFLLTAMTKIAVYAIVLTGVVIVYDLDPLFDYPRLAEGLFFVLALGLALGTMNCLLVTFIPIYDRIWGMVTRPLILLSAVMYLFETVPLPYRDWLWWNPVIHMVGLTRSALYPTYAADYVSPLYLVCIILAVLPVSLFLLRRWWREVLELM